MFFYILLYVTIFTIWHKDLVVWFGVFFMWVYACKSKLRCTGSKTPNPNICCSEGCFEL